VYLSKGTSAQGQVANGTCNYNCFYLSWTLAGEWSSGVHTVNCYTGPGGMFYTYSTTASSDAHNCWVSYHVPVWVVIDGVTSNTVLW
jgi:hypothetical protein